MFYCSSKIPQGRNIQPVNTTTVISQSYYEIKAVVHVTPWGRGWRMYN